MTQYAIVIERGEDGGYGAFVPDLPGCVAVGKTEADVRRLLREAIALHLAAMREDGELIPEPTTQVEYVGLAS
jgi:predicted RNase H-like HicB family nuclease